MWKTLKDINEAGTTIILTTHYLDCLLYTSRCV